MSFLDDILSSMDKNKRPSISKPDKLIQKQFEEQKKIAEKERLIITNFKIKMQNKISQFLKDDEAETIQFEPLEKVFRSVIIETAEETNTGLHCHTFGREERYIVIYKNPPSELELEARRYHDMTKWTKEIEAEFKKKKDEEIEFTKWTSTTSSQDEGIRDPSSTSKSNTKKSKMIHTGECSALGTDLNRNYGMVSTELKKDTRTIEETLNDIQQKKKQKTQHKDE